MVRSKLPGDLLLVHWHAAEAEELAASLRHRGWRVRIGPGELKELRTNPPTAVLISLRRLPSHGREVADALWFTKWGRAIPIVFFDGAPEKIEATRKKFPAARFATWSKVPSTLRELSPHASRPELWQCPGCDQKFSTRNQWHSCGSFDIEKLFAGSQPQVRQLFDRFLSICEACGPVTVIPQKSRVALQVRMRFAAVTPQKGALKGHLVLPRRHPSPRFEKVETYSPRNHVHVFRLISEDQLDPEFRHLIGEAYKVGCQQHLDEPA